MTEPKKHRVGPYHRHKEMIQWLHDNVQENRYENMERYAGSAISQFVEWRSKDLSSWRLRISGSGPAKVDVWIEDPKMEMLFLLKWS